MSTPAPKRWFEGVPALVIASAAVLAGLSGYLAATTNVTGSRTTAMAFSTLLQSNTLQIEANQILVRDDMLLVLADFAEVRGDINLSYELRMKTFAFRRGYIDETGNGTAEYGGSYEEAIAAFINDTYAPSRAARATSDALFAQARQSSERALQFLFITILFSGSAVLGVFASGLKDPRAKMIVVIFLVVYVSASIGYLIYNALA